MKPTTEFEEWRVEQACKLICRDENFLKQPLTDEERRQLLRDRTHWTEAQIDNAVTAIRLNGGATNLD